MVFPKTAPSNDMPKIYQTIDFIYLRFSYLFIYLFISQSYLSVLRLQPNNLDKVQLAIVSKNWRHAQKWKNSQNVRLSEDMTALLE